MKNLIFNSVWLKKKIKERGYTQKNIAEIAGLHIMTMRKVINGTDIKIFIGLLRVCKTLDLNPFDLLIEENVKVRK
jgi:predicted transcriptional regulator